MENSKFKKVCNSADVLVLAFGAMIGWGWVISSGNWISDAGVVGAIVGFIIGGIMIYFVGLVYAELTTAMPKCGGEHLFSYKAFGRIGSFICTWSIILSYIGVVCFEACSFPTILQYIFPNFLQVYLYTIAGFDIYASWLLVAIVTSIAITYINIKGVKSAAKMQVFLTVIIAVVGLLLIFSSSVCGDITNVSDQLFIGESTNGILKNILSIAAIAPFFLFGFDVIPQAAEEINVPLKKLGLLLIISIILAVSFYAFIVLAIGLSLNGQEINSSLISNSLVAADAIKTLFNSEIMAKILIIGGMCGILTSWNSFLIGGSRAIFSMAESYMIPYSFAKLHKEYKTPTNAILLIGGLSIIAPFFGRAVLVWIANTSSFACCIAYCLVSISFLILRKKEPKMDRPYKIKHYRIVGSFAVFMSAFMVVMYIIPNTGSTLGIHECIIAIVWIILGIIFFIFSKIKYKYTNILEGNKHESIND